MRCTSLLAFVLYPMNVIGLFALFMDTMEEHSQRWLGAFVHIQPEMVTSSGL